MPQQEDDTQSTWGPVIGFGLLGIALVAAASKWPSVLQAQGLTSTLPFSGTGADAAPIHPLLELLKLMVAALIGMVVTAVHRRYHRDRPLPRSLLQAQVLLCVAGAMVMVIIGSSVARAFGVAGAAGIVRFRTPVEDPKDTTLLFLLVALGMACGVGLLEVAGLGTVFICIVLVVLDRFGDTKLRTMLLSVAAAGREFPGEHVNRVLSVSAEQFEVREMVQGNEATMKYMVALSPDAAIERISHDLMAGGAAGVKSVSWAEPGKKDK
jgi:hypothetical protein